MKSWYLIVVIILLNCSINNNQSIPTKPKSNIPDTVNCNGVHIPLVPVSFSQTRLCVDMEEPQVDMPYPLNFSYWELFNCMTFKYNELPLLQQQYFLDLFDEILLILNERKEYLNSYCIIDLVSNTLLKIDSSERINSLLFEFSQLDLCSGELHDSHEIGWHVGSSVSRMILNKYMTKQENSVYESQFYEKFRNECNNESNLGECDYFPIKRKIWKEKLVSILNLNQ